MVLDWEKDAREEELTERRQEKWNRQQLREKGRLNAGEKQSILSYDFFSERIILIF